MSQTASNFWVMAELTMLDRAYPTSTKTIRLTNRPTVSSTAGLYMPLLQSVPGIGSRAGDFLPPTQSASITIDDSASSWGYQRRFSDFFDRYDIIDQSIVIYIAETAPDILDPQSSFSAYWRGTVQSFRKNLSGLNPTVSINMSRADIPVNVVTKVITSDEFPTAPLANLGKPIPLVFGAANTIDVQPLQITASSSATVDWAYCTTFSDKAVPIGMSLTSPYVADENGDYISTINSPTTAEDSITNRDPNATVTAQAWKVNETERNFLLLHGTANYALVGLKTYFHDNADAVNRDGVLRFRVLRSLETGAFPTAAPLLGTEVLSQEIKYSDLTLEGVYGGINIYYAKIVFTQPLAVNGGQNYSLSISRTSTVGNIRPINDSATTSTGSGKYQYWKDGNGVWTSLLAEGAPYVSIYAVKFDENKTPSAAEINQTTGLGHSRIRTTIKGGFTSPILCDVSKMNWLLKIGGLKDDASGFFTGSASLTLDRPKRIADLLTSTWASGAWTPAYNYDRTKFSTSHSPTGFDIVIAGRTSGVRNARQVLLDVLRNSFTRIVSEGGAVKNLGLYGYGYTQTSVTTIDDEDAKINAIEFGGTQSIVNRCLIYYDNQLDKITDVRPLSIDGQYKQYQASYDTTKDTTNVVGSYAALIARSQALYGVRDLDNQAFEFLSYRASTTSAAAVAKAIIQQFSDPDITIRFTLPFYKYQTLKIFDVVRLSHPDAPSHLGTSSAAHQPLLSGTGVDLNQEGYFKRAKDLRVLIEGLEVQLNAGEIPLLDVSCKIITGGNVT